MDHAQQMLQHGALALNMCIAWLGNSDNGFVYASACFLMSLLAAGLLRGGVTALRQRAATQRFVEALASLPAKSQAAKGQLAAHDFEIVDTADAFALCHGFWRPRVVVSRGLLDLLLPDELEAVLLHELHHARNHDPLKMLFARTLADVFFFAPIVGEFADRYLGLKELDADDAAMTAQDNRMPMASAFCKVVRMQKSHSIPASLAIGALVSASDERVSHFAGDVRPTRTFSRLALLTSSGLFAFQLVVGIEVSRMTLANETMMSNGPMGLGAYGQAIAWTILCCAAMTVAVKRALARAASTPTAR